MTLRPWHYRAVAALVVLFAVDSVAPEEASGQDRDAGQDQEGGGGQDQDDGQDGDGVPDGSRGPSGARSATADEGEPEVRRHRRRRRRRRRGRRRRRRREPGQAPVSGAAPPAGDGQAGGEAREERQRRRRRRRRRHRRRRRGSRHARESAVPAPPEVPFEGPRFEAGWRFFSMVDFHDEGAVNAIDFSIFPLRGRFRLGGSVEAGLRTSEPDPDILLRTYGSAGYQVPGRVTPFVVATLGLGTAAQKRFHITQWSVLGTLGIDAGAELRLGSAFRLSGSLGLQRALLWGVRYDSLTLRLGLGF